MSAFDALSEKIRKREARCAVIGLGYVGLPLATELLEAGFHVIGIDLSVEKIASLKEGKSYVRDVSSERVAPFVESGAFEVSSDFTLLASADTINIAVPTPLGKTRDPDISYIVSATEEIAANMQPGALVILESTTYPGTTDEVILPLLEAGNRSVGEDFFLAFSPERVDPGNATFTTRNIPKVVGGISPACTELATLLYGESLETVVPVSSSRVAESVKLLENTFRAVNIGLVNEIALICSRMNIDVWEVIDAAATKPFGFMPFYPGPGLGGHCIPIDPFYLSWKARLHGFEARFIELAGEVNGHMPDHVVSRCGEALNSVQRSISGSRILVLGIAYKPDIDDYRESPALEIIKLLQAKGAEVSFTDPWIKGQVPEILDVPRRSLEDSLEDVDLALVVTHHSGVDYEQLLKRVPLCVDTRNVFKGVASPKLFKL
ncbi:MAG: nucleotide sugar dehydrogenase [Candidatus Krumholzibacteria bacterium]|jgi:UDP-N-acetyl-D-glucosamine dehydrogenase|nr:nucleotide sugar dehydrogenase [Candidatus Krumholzibacteria bacterium]MDP6669160.1 nucleotide sugar dehydrogenase [Candidatus Krumholzibacteria bacterium]MDP6797414.1 nucleotide sugar dehydrogenase [Candidatus Krumholzibacteria bacterium]MDP7020872.1 nucleotide sugar dehydrogenase [Candidatus Krumholzibacteria bacterium]